VESVAAVAVETVGTIEAALDVIFSKYFDLPWQSFVGPLASSISTWSTHHYI
jgi:hypothetical protein